jgi:solute carrier family 50 protein (sugar transporter)
LARRSKRIHAQQQSHPTHTPKPQTKRGVVAVAILLVFYAAPLSGVAEVLRARNSAALNEPLAAMAVINGSLWSAYGWCVF